MLYFSYEVLLCEQLDVNNNNKSFYGQLEPPARIHHNAGLGSAVAHLPISGGASSEDEKCKLLLRLVQGSTSPLLHIHSINCRY